jgi:hypothetical protein
MDEKFFRNRDKALEHTLDRRFEEPPQFGGKPGEPVPEVDVDDIKAVAQGCDAILRDAPGEQIGIGFEVIEQFCKPGADARSVMYRHGQLSLLKLMAQHKLIPEDTANKFITDNGFTDAAFRAMAGIPIQWMEVGVVRDSPPYDFDEFLSLCA